MVEYLIETLYFFAFLTGALSLMRSLSTLYGRRLAERKNKVYFEFYGEDWRPKK